jgi:molecular chaperone DnaK
VRSKGGQLQVLAHDGDNHLGGKDFDRAIARFAAEKVREEGALGAFRRTDPAFANAFSRLRSESERVRIELSEAESSRFVIERLVDDLQYQNVGIDFNLMRDDLENLIEPILARTVVQCKNLMSQQRIGADRIKAIVMVGGPTLTPLLPSYLEERLDISAQHVLDPKMIVATGAAMFASTQKAERPKASLPMSSEAPVQLDGHYPAMTTNPRPTYTGRVEPFDPTRSLVAQVSRADGGFNSPPIPLSRQGTFSVRLELALNSLNEFMISMREGDAETAVEPSSFTVLHGMLQPRPLLSQSVGVMLADNTVCWYIRKGTALPAQKSINHATVVSLRRGESGAAVEIPVVQGESDLGDRNKVIGVLRIHAEKITRDLPLGTQVEITLAVDEYSRTTARAHVPVLDMWFDDVVLFRMETKELGQIRQGLDGQMARLEELERLAAELDSEDGDIDGRVVEIEGLLEEGDRDSLDLADQMVRQLTQAIDHAESGEKVANLTQSYKEIVGAIEELLERLAGEDGEDSVRSEGRLFHALKEEFGAALDAGDTEETRLKVDGLRALRFKLFSRTDDFWYALFAYLADRVRELGLEILAQRALQEGRAAIENHSVIRLRQACRKILDILPSEERSKVQGGEGIISSIILAQ